MQLSLNWVNKFTSLPNLSAADLSLKITMATVEIEGFVKQAELLQGIVVGQIKELVKHPQADRLWVCKTNIGLQTVQIICGGNNLRENMLVAVATVGSKVRWHGEGELVALEATKIRGLESKGMIVASAEVGLVNLFPAASDHEIIDLSDFKLKPGTPLSQALGLDDVILEIDNKSMTHRPDLWGQYGMARELAAVFQVKCKPHSIPVIAPDTTNDKLTVTLSSPACYRLSAVVMDGIEIGPSPFWLKRSLDAVGIRSVNNLVDITNYVMMELGHPMHAFNYNLIQDHLINVKELSTTEKMETLDGQKRKLEAGTLVLADSKKSLDIAGIMGGQASSIQPGTNKVLLTVANFQASKIRLTSMKLGLRTEASSRYEKSLDPNLTSQALGLAVQLIKQIIPTSKVTSKVVDINNSPEFSRSIILPKEFISNRVGVAIPDKTVKDILTRLHFEVKNEGKHWLVTVPSWRATKDISIPEDLVEEVARIYGYDAVTPSLPLIMIEQPEKNLEQQLERQLKDLLVYDGRFFEIYNYSFASNTWAERLQLTKDQLTVKNYLTDDQKYLRTSLLPGLLQRAEENLRWDSELRLMESGRVFHKGKGEYVVDNTNKHYLPDQPKQLAGVITSKAISAEHLYLQTKGLLVDLLKFYNFDFNLARGEQVGGDKVLFIMSHDQVVGSFGLLNKPLTDAHFPKLHVVWWQINFPVWLKYADLRRSFSAFPKYPALTRDLAIIVEREVNWDSVYSEVSKTSPLIEKVELFDIFQSDKLGLNKKSLAFSLSFRNPERTLSSDEADQLMARIMANLKEKFQAIQR